MGVERLWGLHPWRCSNPTERTVVGTCWELDGTEPPELLPAPTPQGSVLCSNVLLKLVVIYVFVLTGEDK